MPAVPSSDVDRLVTLEGVQNFRDLGGYPTRDGHTTKWRTLYRADGLQRLTAADVESLRPLGLATVIDLRTPTELNERGRFPLEQHPAQYHHLPVIESVWDINDEMVWGPDAAEVMLHLYLDMFEQGERELARLLMILADPSAYPAVYHCAAGKDRTGIVSAVILGVLGVPAEIIAEDYALSAEAMERIDAWYRENRPDVVDRMVRYPPAFRVADPRTMVALLHLVEREHGSMVGYAGSIGVERSVIETIRANLLD